MPESRKLNFSRRAMVQGALATAGGLALNQSGLLAAWRKLPPNSLLLSESAFSS
jgi:hypothetical protein